MIESAGNFELRPCPFCESDKVMLAINPLSDGVRRLFVRCECCGGRSKDVFRFPSCGYDAEGEAIKAWNRRDGHTCKDVGRGTAFKCSECGCELDLSVDGEPTLWDNRFPDVPTYCPGCGRKVEYE